MSKQMNKLNKKQSGFTLIEIAIVMGIIGVLLGGVIKGQELINTAKEKRIYSDYKSLQAAIFVYVDRFGVYPGDNGNGAYDDTDINGTNSQAGFWASLKQSGFVEGKAKTGTNFNNANEKNAFGGEILFTANKDICFSQIPRLPSKNYVDNNNATAYLIGSGSAYSTTEATTAELNNEDNNDFKVCFAS